MAYRFGIYPKNERANLIENGIGGQLVENSNIYPRQQTISIEDFEKIKKILFRKCAGKIDPKPIGKIARYRFI